MNKYLEKIAKISEENKQTLKTFAESTAVGLPLGIAGAKIGHAVGTRFGKPSVGTFIGSHALGGLGELVAIKRGLNSHAKTLKEK